MRLGALRRVKFWLGEAGLFRRGGAGLVAASFGAVRQAKSLKTN